MMNDMKLIASKTNGSFSKAWDVAKMGVVHLRKDKDVSSYQLKIDKFNLLAMRNVRDSLSGRASDVCGKTIEYLENKIIEAKKCQ